MVVEFHVFDQKYVYTDYHLKSLLRQWKQLKSRFEAKLTTRISPEVKPLLLYSLFKLQKRIESAASAFERVALYTIYLFKTQNYQGYKLKLMIKIDKDSNVLYSTAAKATYDIDIMGGKMKQVDPIPFKKLPYEFQHRLVALLPNTDLIEFKLAEKTAAKQVIIRGLFYDYLKIVENNDDFQEAEEEKTVNGKTTAIVYSDNFLKMNNVFIRQNLSLQMDSIEKFDKALKVITGTYILLELGGVFTWRQAIELMGRSKELLYIAIEGIKLELEEFDAFFRSVKRWLKQKGNNVLMLVHGVSLLPPTFHQRFKEYIESRTAYKIFLKDNCSFVYVEPEL